MALTALAVSEPVTNLTQEVRLSSPKDSAPLRWQVGGYYNHEFANEYEQFFFIDPTTREVLYNSPANLGTYHNVGLSSQAAEFFCRRDFQRISSGNGGNKVVGLPTATATAPLPPNGR